MEEPRPLSEVSVSAETTRRYRTYRPLDPALLNRAEAALHIGVSVSTLEHWAGDRRGPAFRKIGQSTYYAINDLRAWMSNLPAIGGL